MTVDDDGTTDAAAGGDDPAPRPANLWPGPQAGSGPAPVPPSPPVSEESAPRDPQPGWRPGWPAQTPGGPAGPPGAVGFPQGPAAPGFPQSPPSGIPGFSGAVAGAPPGGPPVGPGPGGWPAHALAGDRPSAVVVDHRTRNAVLACIGVVVVATVVITFGVIATNQKPKPLPYFSMSSYEALLAVGRMCTGGRALSDGPLYVRGGKDQWAVVTGDIGATSAKPLDLHPIDPDGRAPEFTKSNRFGAVVCVTAVQHLVTRQCEADVGFNKDHFAIDTSTAFAFDVRAVRTGRVLHRGRFVVTEPDCPQVLRLTRAGQLVNRYSDEMVDDATAKAMQLAHQYDTGR